MVKVSRHTVNMNPSLNIMKDGPSLWLSILVRKYGVILDCLDATARGVTHC